MLPKWQTATAYLGTKQENCKPGYLLKHFHRLVYLFLADIKGDIAGMAKPGELNEKIRSVCAYVGLIVLRLKPFLLCFGMYSVQVAILCVQRCQKWVPFFLANA